MFVGPTLSSAYNTFNGLVYTIVVPVCVVKTLENEILSTTLLARNSRL